MSGFNTNTSVAPDPVYEWRYEYYDDEEPVSFEGLKAHRCKYQNNETCDGVLLTDN